jgi:hypothetical protein
LRKSVTVHETGATPELPLDRFWRITGLDTETGLVAALLAL